MIRLQLELREVPLLHLLIRCNRTKTSTPQIPPIDQKFSRNPPQIWGRSADLGGIKRAVGTVERVLVEVIGVVELGALVHQGRLRRRRGLVPLRPAVAIVCRGEERGATSTGEPREGVRGGHACLGPPPHRRRRPWLGRRGGCA